MNKQRRILIILVVLCLVVLGTVGMVEVHENPPMKSKIADFELVSNNPSVAGCKVILLYIGAEACPFCVAESWGIVSALDQFGTLRNITEIHSSSKGGEPNVQGYGFSNSSYNSSKVAFWEVEVTASSWTQKLQSLNATELRLMNKYDPNGSIPFILIGGLYLEIGSMISPVLLSNLSWQQCINLSSEPGKLHNMIQDEAFNITEVLLYVEKLPHNSISISLSEEKMVIAKDSDSSSQLLLGLFEAIVIFHSLHADCQRVSLK